MGESCSAICSPGELDGVRLMNADGTGESQIEDDAIADLTAAGCTICPYAPAAQRAEAVSGHGDAYWRPAP